MSKLRLRDAALPTSLHGPILVDHRCQPRFWATVWAEVSLGAFSDATRDLRLAEVEQLYISVAEQFGTDLLDGLIARTDFDSLEAVLGAFLAKLHNQSAIRLVDMNSTWRTARKFVEDVMIQFGLESEDKMARISSRLRRLQRLYGQITPSRQRAPTPIRALPAVVMADLYEVFNPDSRRNPFRTPAVRWRNHLIFLMCLQMGLRKGELLVLPADAVKDDYDVIRGTTTFWINIVESRYGDADSRYTGPSIKTTASRRQLPMSKQLVQVVDTYTKNYRGACPHSYLFSSQKMKPLALSSVGKIFAVASTSLTTKSKKALLDRGIDRVSPHNLRHTAACVRLAKYVAGGDDLDRASEKLRVFFGWSRTSKMPLLYARAYFETKLADVWSDNFDSYVDALRQLTGERQ